jgi:hypothetical protein
MSAVYRVGMAYLISPDPPGDADTGVIALDLFNFLTDSKAVLNLLTVSKGTMISVVDCAILHEVFQNEELIRFLSPELSHMNQALQFPEENQKQSQVKFQNVSSCS